MSYTCYGGDLSNPCMETNVSDEHTGEMAFFECDRCKHSEWQRRADLPPALPLPVDAYFSVRFPHSRWGQEVWVAHGDAAHAHLVKLHGGVRVVLRYDELALVAAGVAEVGDPAQRATRLMEALNYYAQEQGVAPLVL